MSRSPRKEREITHIRDDVLRAAARAIPRHGLEATTIHDIAREAGYTAQTLYTYFKGKQEIIDSLIVLMGMEMMATFDDNAPPGMTFRQRLELLLRRQVNFIEHWREAFIVFFAAKALSDPVVAAVRQDRDRKSVVVPNDPFQERLTDWIRETARPRDIGGHEPEDAALFLRGLTATFFIKGIIKDPKGRLSDQVGTILDLFFHGITGGQQSHAAGRARTPRPARQAPHITGGSKR